MTSEPTIRCTLCAAVFTDEQIKGATSCPNCSYRGIPMAIADDVTVDINWHELRILIMWAERWAQRNEDTDPTMEAAVQSIASRIAAQHPDRRSLTFIGEVGELRETFGDVQVFQDGKERKPS